MVTALLVAALVSMSAPLESCCPASIPATRTGAQAASERDAEDRDKLTRLMRSSAIGDLDEVNRLLERGADPNLQSSEHRVTALMFASYFGHAEVVKALIARGARVDLKDNGGAGAIDWAAVGGHDAIVQLVADERAALNPFLTIGSMPLWLMDLAAGKRK
jgi:ankyrin repeat protein